MVQVIARHGDKVPTTLPVPAGHQPTWVCNLTMVSTTSGAAPGTSLPSPGTLFRRRYLEGDQLHPGNCAAEQLTALGHAQHVHNGSLFRQRYVDEYGLLPSMLEDALPRLFVFHTDTDRTRQSAQSFVQGLYPQTSGAATATQVDAFTVHAGSPHNFMGPPTPCASLQQRLAAIKASAPWTSRHAAAAPVAAQLQRAWNLSSESAMPDWPAVWGVAQAQLAHGLGLPYGVDMNVFDVALNVTVADAMQQAADQVINRLTIGQLVHRLLSAMQSVVDGGRSTDSKRGTGGTPAFSIYLGHDSTLWPLLGSFNITDGVWPQYAATVAFELLSSSGAALDRAETPPSYFVRVLHNLVPVALPACAAPGNGDTAPLECPWSTFQSIALQAALAPSDVAAACADTGAHASATAAERASQAAAPAAHRIERATAASTALQATAWNLTVNIIDGSTGASLPATVAAMRDGVRVPVEGDAVAAPPQCLAVQTKPPPFTPPQPVADAVPLPTAAVVASYVAGGRFTVPGPDSTVGDNSRVAIDLRVERGPEWVPFHTRLVASAGSDPPAPVTASLTRVADMNALGWYSADFHVHGTGSDPDSGVLSYGRIVDAVDINLVPVLTHWDLVRVNATDPIVQCQQDASEGAGRARTRCVHTMNQEDERGPGAYIMMNLTRPIDLPVEPPGGGSSFWPAGLQFHRQAVVQESAVGGGAVFTLEKDFWWEAPVHVALGGASPGARSGAIHSVGTVVNQVQADYVKPENAWGRPWDAVSFPGARGWVEAQLQTYYAWLNLGFQMAASAGTATCLKPSPLGFNRVYAYVGAYGTSGCGGGSCGASFSSNEFWDAVVAGRTFATNGPLFTDMSLGGQSVGWRFDVQDGGSVDGGGSGGGAAGGRADAAFTSELRFSVVSARRIRAVEVVQDSHVVATAVPTAGTNGTSVDGTVSVSFSKSGWLALRAWEADTGGDVLCSDANWPKHLPGRVDPSGAGNASDACTTLRYAHSSPWYVDVGGTRPNNSTAAEFFSDWIRELVNATEQRAAAAKDPTPFKPVLQLYNAAAAVYEAMTAGGDDGVSRR